MHDKEFLKMIGHRIRSLRKSQKLSQEELAELSDLHPTYIGEIERGTVNASITSLKKIADALRMSLSEVFKVPVKNEEEELIVQKILVLLNNKDKKVLRYVEKSIIELIELIRPKKKKK